MNAAIANESKSCFCRDGPTLTTDVSAGETACCKCGMVVGTVAEYPHVSDNLSIPGGNLSSTKIEGSSRMVKASQMAQKADTAFINSNNLASMCCSKLGLPSAVRRRALDLFKKFRTELRGRNVTVLTSVVLYVSCREHMITRSMSEICLSVGADLKATRKAYKRIHKSYEISLPIQASDGFVTRIVSNMGLPEKVARRALEILNELKGRNLVVGRHPVSMAAYVVHAAANEFGDVTAASVAAASNVTAHGILNIGKSINAETEQASL